MIIKTESVEEIIVVLFMHRKKKRHSIERQEDCLNTFWTGLRQERQEIEQMEQLHLRDIQEEEDPLMKVHMDRQEETPTFPFAKTS